MIAVRTTGFAVFFAMLMAAGFTAQAPPRVDFQRDVEPILRDRCYACHGPEQQMNGLRLDRRADAMRGGTQSVIGPGNADGSKLYHRLVDTSVGTRMPPSRPLGADEVATLKAWIDQGADWPDELAGMAPSLPVDPDAERLARFLRSGDRAGIDDVLRRNSRAAGARASGGSTPLMFAALYGDAPVMKRLIDLGAAPGAVNTAGATALMWATPDTGKMRLLLDAGANVETRSDDRRTALVTAAGMVDATPAVTLLLEYGANPSSSSASDPSPLREAARVNNIAAFRLLLEYGADASGLAPAFLRTNCFQCAEAIGVGGAGPLARVPPVDTGLRPSLSLSASPMPTIEVTSATPAAIHAAVERGLPLLQKIGVPFIQKTGCVSCHHNSLVGLAVAVARRNGYRVDDEEAGRQRAIVATYVESWRERQVYAPATLEADYRKAIALARDWLVAAKAASTEERAFRLLGLTWAEAGRALVTAAAQDLLAAQHTDGGWSQDSSMASDAYATGEALVALHESGAVRRSDPSIGRGVGFLLRAQHADGSWFVKSRAVPIQAYFESGFPYGADQWISAAASAWAVTALAAQNLDISPIVPTPATALRGQDR